MTDALTDIRRNQEQAELSAHLRRLEAVQCNSRVNEELAERRELLRRGEALLGREEP